MDEEFKRASTLYEDETAKKQLTKFKVPEIIIRKCEHYSPECCEVSREAVNLGLAKAVFPCNGNIPPDCVIRQDLAAGKTIQELYEK